MMRILAVDDDSVALMAIEEALTIAGYDVSLATDGDEAIDILQTETIRIVITDWNMARIDGLELCRAIRSNSTRGYVYVILLTGREGTNNIIEALAAGADEILSKPFQPVELVMRLRAAERIVALDTRDLTIFALAKLAESRDAETGLHLERVRSYSKVLADEVAGVRKLPPGLSQLIYQTSPLHDIGKVGIPDRILCKPGPLTDDEFEIMKTHTSIGADTLETVTHEYPDVPFLETASDIARTHHERFDGTGYPNGLNGEDIPLTGRIVAVADVYDALTNQRAYKPPFSHEFARQSILEASGSHFDPQIVKAFIATERKFLTIHEQFSNEACDDLMLMSMESGCD